MRPERADFWLGKLEGLRKLIKGPMAIQEGGMDGKMEGRTSVNSPLSYRTLHWSLGAAAQKGEIVGGCGIRIVGDGVGAEEIKGG